MKSARTVVSVINYLMFFCRNLFAVSSVVNLWHFTLAVEACGILHWPVEACGNLHSPVEACGILHWPVEAGSERQTEAAAAVLVIGFTTVGSTCLTQLCPIEGLAGTEIPGRGKEKEYKMMPNATLISLVVSVDVKHRVYLLTYSVRAQELCESRRGRPGHPAPISPHGLCGCNATLNFEHCHHQKDVDVTQH